MVPTGCPPCGSSRWTATIGLVRSRPGRRSGIAYHHAAVTLDASSTGTRLTMRRHGRRPRRSRCAIARSAPHRAHPAGHVPHGSTADVRHPGHDRPPRGGPARPVAPACGRGGLRAARRDRGLRAAAAGGTPHLRWAEPLDVSFPGLPASIVRTADRAAPIPRRGPALRSADAARHDRPRTRRPVRARVHAAARAHADPPVADRGPLGLLGAHPRRAADPRGARRVPGGRRDRARRPHRAWRRTGSTLARRAGGAERAPPRDRRGLVSRCLLPARAAGRSPVGRFTGRGARRRGHQRDRGHGRPAGDPGRDRHGQAVGDAGRGARPPGRRPREAAGRASRSRRTPSCPTWGPRS